MVIKLLLLVSLVLIHTVTIVQAAEDTTTPITLSAPDDIKELLTQHFELPQEPLVNSTARSFFMRRANQEIAELLATEGYFNPTVKLQPLSQKEKKFVLEIEPGIQTTVGSVSIEFQGKITMGTPQNNYRISQLRKQWLLKTGEPFRSVDWEESKAELLSNISNEDYAAAHIVTSLATVDPDKNLVDLEILIDSGPAFYFGELVITGLKRYQDREINLRNFMSFKAGDPYRRNLLLAFQAALQNIPHFSSVTVSTNNDVTMHDAIPINVVIKEQKSKQIGLGAGFSSNSGLRGEINYRNHDFLERAMDSNILLRLEQKRQTFSTSVSKLPDSKNNRYSVGARWQRTDIEDLVTLNQRLSFSRSHQTVRVSRELGLIWQIESKEPSGGDKETNKALTLDWRWRYHKIDNPLNIRRGNVTDVRLGASPDFVADERFIRSYARQQSWLPIGKRHVLYLRGEVGYTLADSSSGIPQEFLFRAGGIQSIRGLAFLSQGVRDGNAIVGGRTLATGTIEYTHWLFKDWGGAIFTDIGDAADSWGKFGPELGYGGGLRWRSPAGPLALDLARRNKTGKLRVHFSVMVAF